MTAKIETPAGDKQLHVVSLASLYEALKEVDNRRNLTWSLGTDKIQYEDPVHGFLIYITYEQEDTLTFTGWTLPALEDLDGRRDLSVSRLALYIASTEEPSILKNLSISQTCATVENQVSSDSESRSTILAKFIVPMITKMLIARDMYPIVSRIPSLSFEEYGGIQPYQASGIFDKIWSFYFRYRSGEATLSISKDDMDTIGEIYSYPYWKSHINQGEDAPFDFPTMFIELFNKLQMNPATPIAYTFQLKNGEETYTLLGSSLSDAIETLKQELLTHNKMQWHHATGQFDGDYEKWARKNPPADYNLRPVSKKPRVYPISHPKFIVIPDDEALTLRQVLSSSL